MIIDSTVLIGVVVVFLYVVGQALVLTAIKMASDGTTEKMPDGTEKDSDMILYPINKYLQQTKVRHLYYTGVQLVELMDRIKKDLAPMDVEPSEVKYDEIIYNEYRVAQKEVFLQMIKNIERMYNLKVVNNHDYTGFHFLREIEEHRFSKWVRMPTLGCITCMPSLWSLLTYWLPVVLVFGFCWMQFVYWILNVCALSTTATWMYKTIKAK